MDRSPKIMLLVDWQPQDEFLLARCFRENGARCETLGTDFIQAKWTPFTKVFSHWPRCFMVAWKAYRRRGEYDYAVAWSQVAGVMLGLIKLFTFSRLPRMISLNATLIERKNLFLEMPRRWLIALAYKKIDHLSFLSEGSLKLTKERYGLAEEQCVHLKQPLIFRRYPEYSGFKKDGYLYTVGMSYRDFATLMAAAAKSSRRFVVATTDAFLKGLSIPENVTVYRDAFDQKAEELMKNAAAAIFPLERIDSPAGETTLVSAMCYGKPVITTSTITTREYVTHGVDGLLVPWKDPEAIAAAVETLFADPGKAGEMGRKARETALENHGMEGYAKRILDLIGRDLQDSNTEG